MRRGVEAESPQSVAAASSALSGTATVRLGTSAHLLSGTGPLLVPISAGIRAHPTASAAWIERTYEADMARQSHKPLIEAHAAQPPYKQKVAGSSPAPPMHSGPVGICSSRAVKA